MWSDGTATEVLPIPPRLVNRTQTPAAACKMPRTALTETTAALELSEEGQACRWCGRSLRSRSVSSKEGFRELPAARDLEADGAQIEKTEKPVCGEVAGTALSSLPCPTSAVHRNATGPGDAMSGPTFETPCGRTWRGATVVAVHHCCAGFWTVPRTR
jgi:hypothetical protein